jgi:hypothetical protein
MAGSTPSFVSFAACRLEALSVDDGRSRLVVLLLTDPHLLEGTQTSENGASDPDRVLSLGRRDDLDLHRGRSEVGNLLLHAVGDARVHGGTAREHSVRVEILSDVDVALHDRVVRGLVDAYGLHTEEGRLEKRFRTSESLVRDGDDLSVRQLVTLLKAARTRSS